MNAIPTSQGLVCTTNMASEDDPAWSNVCCAKHLSMLAWNHKHDPEVWQESVLKTCAYFLF